VHHALKAALAEAQAAGVVVWRCSRCGQGSLVGAADEPAAGMTPWQARVTLMLALLGGA